MAEKPNKNVANPKQQPPSGSGLGLKVLAMLVTLLILVTIGFAAGVYFQFIDVAKLARDMKLDQYPVIGSYLPKTNFEPVDLAEDDTSAGQEAPVQPEQSQKPASAFPVPQVITPDLITPEDLEKQDKLRQQEENKRIGRLARLYGSMKPDEATTIMQELDDATVVAIFSKMEEEQVAKILARFDSKRAASLTQDMLRGKAQLPNL